ncbi:hypothetical protein DV736_g4558, partial [Chaetothyriales sp. CBS 134916]
MDDNASTSLSTTTPTMALPPFLLIEVHAAFRTCARRNTFQKASPLSLTLAPARFLRTGAANRSPARRPTTNVPEAQSSSAWKADTAQSGEPSTQLTPSREKKEDVVDTGGKVDVPLRVIPPAKISPTTKLLPQERLHIEHLTRHPPPKNKMPGFRETVLVYHLGNLKIMWMIFLRVFTATSACTMAMIWMPAYYQWGAPLWVIATVGLATLLPTWMITYWFKGVITEIRLKLPPSARQSAKTAMEYARNLPRDATIEVRCHYWTSLPAIVTMRIGDTVPISKRINLPPVSFRWVGPRVDRGTFLYPIPTDFWVGPQTSGGIAARTTVPGLWEALYKRLTGLDAVSGRKWKG